MANIKFSGFTAVTDIAGIQEIVGYNGTANVRISPVNFINSSGGPYLPLVGGTMVGAITMSGADDFITFNVNNAAVFDNSNNNNPFYIRNSGGNAATLQVGTGSPGGNVKFLIEGGGNVGIGTNSPTVGLQLGNSVSGETKLAIFNSEGGGEVGLTIKSRTNRAKLRVSDNDSNAYVVAEAGKAFFGASANGDTNNITVLTGGNVGIGTTSPGFPLHVSKSVSGDYVSRITNTNSTSGSNYGLIVDGGSTAADVSFQVKNLAGGSYLMVRGDGNVGIGTGAPLFKLQVAGSVALDVMPGNQSEGIVRIGRYDANTTRYNDIKSFVSATAASNYLKFAVHGGVENATVDVMTLLGSGNVGIGTDTPLAKLHLSDPAIVMYLEDSDSTASYNITSISNSGNNLTLDTRNSSGGFVSTDYQIIKNTSGAEAHRWLTQGSEKMRIFSNGSLQFNAYNDSNNTGTATFLLGTDANGNVVKTTTVPSGSGGPFLPLAGGTMTGNLTLSSALPLLYLTNTTASTGKNWRLSSATNGKFFIAEEGVVDAVTLDSTTGNATFAGDVNMSNTSGATLNINSAQAAADSKILLHEGTTASPANGASIRYDGSSNLFKIGVGTNVDTTRLTISRDTGNATFEGDVTIAKATPVLTFNNLAGGGLDPSLTASGSNFTISTSSLTALSLALDTGNATFAGDVLLGDNKNLDFGSATDFRIVHNSTTNVNHISSKLDRQLSINANIINLTNQANDSTYLKLESTAATFAGNVTVGNNGNINIPTAASGNANLNFDGTDFKITSNSSSANLKLETSSTTRLTINSSGNATFAGNVTLENASSPTITIQDTTSDVKLLLYSQNGDSHVGTYSNHSLVFDTNSSEQMRITSTGNVGIGVAAPSTALEVAGHITINSPGGASQTSYGLRLRKTNSSSVVQPGGEILASPYPTNTNAANLIFKTADTSANLTQRMLIDGVGDVEISTTAKGLILKSPDGTRYRVTVANGGTLSVAAV